MSAELRLALFLAAAAVILLGAAAAATLITGRPPSPAGPPVGLSEADLEQVVAACIRITLEAAGGG